MNLVKILPIIVLMNLVNVNPVLSDLWKKTNGPFGTDVNHIAYDDNLNIIYVATNNDGIYKSVDSGDSWSKMNKGELKDDETVNFVFISNRGDVFAVTDSSGIFLLNDDGYWVAKNSGFGGHLSFSCMLQLNDNSLVLASKGKAIFKSTNNGDNWSNYNSGLNYDEYINTITSVNNNLYLGSNNGFYISKDKGKKWTMLKNDIGIVNTLCNFNDSLLFIGTNKGLFVSNLSGSLVTQCTSSQNNINVISIQYDNGLIYFIDDESGIYTYNLNSSSKNVEQLLPKTGLKYLIAIDSSFFVAFKQGVFFWDTKSITYKNNGLSNLTTNDIISIDRNVYCATNNGIYLSTNEGFNWEPSNNGLGKNFNVTSLHFSKSKILLAGTSGEGLYYSEDYGKNWVKNDNPDLTSIYINDIAMDSLGNVYVGTIGKGVFKSSDGGLTWIQMFGNGLENLEITKLVVNPNNEVFAGTPDNGMFIKTATSNWRYIENLPVGIKQIYDIELINENNNNIIVISTNLGIYNSFSNGENWIKTNSNLQAPAVNLYYNEYDSTLYAGLKYVHGLFKSNDYGNSWENVIDKSGLSSKKITSIAMSSLGFLYSGTERGLVFRTIGSFRNIKPEPAFVTVMGKKEFCEGGFTILKAEPKFFEIRWSTGKKSLFDTVWQSGQYWFTAKDTLGFTVMSDTVTVKVYPKPNKPYVLFNGEILLCSEDAFGYRWYYEGKPIDNSNSKSLKPDKDGWYQCEIFSEYNCKNTSDEIYVELTSVDESKKENSQEIIIYPNPANDFIIINIKENNKIEIFSSTGKRLIEAKSGKTVDISNLNRGLYFVKINYHNKNKILSFIKN